MLSKILFLSVIIVLSGIMYSCEYNIEEPLDEMPDCNPQISFNQIVKPILDNNCVFCHNGSQFPDLRMHESIGLNSALIKEEVVSRRMPIGASLTQKEIDDIACWIDSGALNN